MISGEKVRAILSFGGFPDGGLAMRESYIPSYLNVHQIFHGDIIGENGVRLSIGRPPAHRAEGRLFLDLNHRTI
jgi:hypothetical protein